MTIHVQFGSDKPDLDQKQTRTQHTFLEDELVMKHALRRIFGIETPLSQAAKKVEGAIGFGKDLTEAGKAFLRGVGTPTPER